jgi:hypothetical protein
MPPHPVAIALAILFVAGACYAEWVAAAPRGDPPDGRARWEVLFVHAAALIQLAVATALIVVG